MFLNNSRFHYTIIFVYTGMQVVGLKSFIERHPDVINQLFPTRKDCHLSAKAMKEKVIFNNDESLERNAMAKNFFLQYMDLIENRKEGEYNTDVEISVRCRLEHSLSSYSYFYSLFWMRLNDIHASYNFGNLNFIVGAELADLCCFWTGSKMLPPRSDSLYVAFDNVGNIVLPMAECCFFSLVLPVKHTSFEDFKKFMDSSLKYGSSGFCFS